MQKREMSEVILSSISSHVRIISRSLDLSHIKADILANRLLYRFIPDLDFERKVKEAVLRIEDGSKIDVNFSLRTSLIRGKYGEDFDSTDIIVTTEYLLERLRQERGVCTIHSSSIFKNDRAVLFFANVTGAGKTSLALYLTNIFDYKLFSDEKTLVDLKKVNLVGQTKKIFVEYKTRKKLMTCNVRLPHEVEVAKVANKRLVLLVVPIITPQGHKIQVTKYSKDQLKWALFEEFSKDIRLVNGLILGLSHPLIPLDNFKISKQREKFVDILCDTVPCYRMVGPLDLVAEKTNQLFLKLSSKSN